MDCMDYLYEVPDNAFALAIIDPPYGIGADKPHKKPSIARQRNGTYLRVKTNDYAPKKWDATPPDERFFDELFRVSRNQIIFGANYFGLKGGMIVWDKLNYGSDQYGCEIAYQSFNQRTDIVHYMWRGMIQGAYCSDDVGRALVQQGNKQLNEQRIHPTQKPVALYVWLLRRYATRATIYLIPILAAAVPASPPTNLDSTLQASKSTPTISPSRKPVSAVNVSAKKSPLTGAPSNSSRYSDARTIQRGADIMPTPRLLLYRVFTIFALTHLQFFCMLY